MEFHSVTTQKRATRVDTLKDMKGKPDVETETTCILLHTQGGLISHITHENFQLVSERAQILQIHL